MLCKQLSLCCQYDGVWGSLVVFCYEGCQWGLLEKLIAAVLEIVFSASSFSLSQRLLMVVCPSKHTVFLYLFDTGVQINIHCIFKSFAFLWLKTNFYWLVKCFKSVYLQTNGVLPINTESRICMETVLGHSSFSCYTLLKKSTYLTCKPYCIVYQPLN